MAKINFYPLGNADTCLITLSTGENILVDYANMRDENNDQDLRVDLPEILRSELGTENKDYLDVLIITHADSDHIKGFSDFFYLEHAKKYQSEDRIKINELWVPAAVILEKHVNEEHQILRAEARHRFKIGENVRVFSKPDLLEEWLSENGLSLDERQHLITNAGNLVPTFDIETMGAEFFVHAPFSESVDGNILRNDAALVLQVVFEENGQNTKLILGADSAHNVWENIVNISTYYEREDRLNWDIFKISHHCSYLSLSDEKGETITEPIPEVDWLFRNGNNSGILISSSDPLPDSYDDVQPPHRQASNYYEEVAEENGGEFIVTMEHPTEDSPQPLVIGIDEFGATKKILSLGAVSVIRDRRPPRAG